MALRPADGAMLWRLPYAGDSGLTAPPLVAGDLLIAAHDDGVIRAVNRNTRQENMGAAAGLPLAAPPSYAAGKIYAHTQDGKLHVIR